MYVVLIETSGNQDYIFATNKLRENVGASELTYQVGTKFVIDAVRKVNNASFKIPETYTELKAFLLDEKQNPRFPNRTESASPNGDLEVEIIIATSGKALLLAKDRSKAKQIVGIVTERALREAPGLSVYGVISEDFTLGEKDLDDVMREVHEQYEVVRSKLPGPKHRFLRFPFAQSCATSEFPAQHVKTYEPKSNAYSTVSIGKYRAFNAGQTRMLSVTRSVSGDVTLPENLDRFEKAFPSTDWLAVIHADGNGLGQIFLNFGDASGCKDWREYLDREREFSLALDDCTINAYGKATSKLQSRKIKEIEQRRAAGETVSTDEEKRIPLIPLVLGGDDLTLICDGRHAIGFAKDFLLEFENQTATNNIIKPIAGSALGVEKLSSCAGVAIVKPHFPFHVAYDLAEDLLQSAKNVKKVLLHQHKNKTTSYPASALDYHILYDTSGVDLERLREQLRIDATEMTRLYGRPYLITPESELKKFKNDDWLKFHRWAALESRVAALTNKDERNRRLLPNSMLHDLREALFMGKEGADGQMQLVRKRFKDKGFDELLGSTDPPSLFWNEYADGETVCVTGFLDALDIVEFWSTDDGGQAAEAKS